MKTFLTTLAFFAVLSWSTACNAEIIDITMADDGDGVLICHTNTYTNYLVNLGIDGAIPEYEYVINGEHKLWGTGDIYGHITTDTEEDPKLTLLHDIDNDTIFDWTGYLVLVSMSKTFTFDNVTVANADWTFVVTQPVLVGSDWVGTIGYSTTSNPVAPLDTLSFGYRMTFLGSADFHEELTPINASVPEPGMLALMAGGLVGLFVARRKFVG
jgi:hypothetical protein